MTTVAFIGHHNAHLPPEWEARLAADLRAMALQAPVQFYVGAEGSFDRAIHRILEELAGQSDHVYFTVVLSSVPASGATGKPLPPHADALIPAGIESVPPRLRIIKRDEWMIRRSQIVITCFEHTLSNAHCFMEYAGNQGKIVLNLPDFYAERAR